MKDTLSNEHMSGIMPLQSHNSGCSVWFCSIHPFTPCLLETSWVLSSQMSSQDAFKFMLAFCRWYAQNQALILVSSFIQGISDFSALDSRLLKLGVLRSSGEWEISCLRWRKSLSKVIKRLIRCFTNPGPLNTNPIHPLLPTPEQFLLSDPTESLVLIGPASLVSLPT